jgi:c-di-GMP-binding flagellar brake protein YcgR
MQKIVRRQIMKDNAIQVNNKIEIILADDDKRVVGHSLIQQVFDDSFSIMLPVSEGNTLYYDMNAEVIISVLINNVRYSFRTEVIDKAREGNLRLLLLKMPQKLELADRRTLVRIKTLLPIKYKIIEADQRDIWQITSLTRRPI